jgi:hypothetical protein
VRFNVPLIAEDYVYRHDIYSCICRRCRGQRKQVLSQSEQDAKLDALKKGRRYKWIYRQLAAMPLRDGPERWAFMVRLGERCQARHERLLLMRRMWEQRKNTRFAR